MPIHIAINICFNDVNNQQDATTLSFINLFKSPLHVTGDKFAHRKEQFFLLYIQQCRCIAPKALYTVKKVPLRMGEFIARNM